VVVFIVGGKRREVPMSHKTIMRMAVLFPLHVLLLLVIVGIHELVDSSVTVKIIGLSPSTIATAVYCIFLLGSLA